jgi:hypothetical protein
VKTYKLNSSAIENIKSDYLSVPIIFVKDYFTGSGGSTGSINPTSSTTLLATLVGSTTGFRFNLVWDASVTSSAFQISIQNASLAIAKVLADKITVNIGITNSGTGSGASAGPSGGLYETYSWVYSHLKNSADPTFNYLSNTNSVQGQSNVAVWNAQLKMWGLNPTSSLDGSAKFATGISSSALFGVALHELTHSLGRVPYGSSPDCFDLFRFTAPGQMLFSSSIPSALAYFSIDNGVTNLAYYGINSDPSDFYNGTPNGKLHSLYNTTYDAFSEYYYSNGSSNQYLSALDLHSLDALGYHLKALNTVSAGYSFATPTPIIVSDTSSHIQFTLDNLNANINSIYSISQTDNLSLNITASQSVDDCSVLMLMNLYEKLSVNIDGTSGNDTIYGLGNDTINGGGGTNTISLLCHTSSTIDKIYHNSTVVASNLDMVYGFLSTDNIQLANSLGSLNGLTNLTNGSLIASGASALVNIQSVAAGKSFTVSSNNVDILDIVGSVFTNVGALITNLSSNSNGSTYATFGATVGQFSHFLVEYSANDGIHIAEITQGASSNHLSSTSTGVDLIDLVGVTQHILASHWAVLAA